jgi:hypothetical protein
MLVMRSTKKEMSPIIGRRFIYLTVLLIPLLLSACGTFEVGIEGQPEALPTTGVGAIATATGVADNGAIETSTPTPAATGGGDPTPTRIIPTSMPDDSEGKVYTNSVYDISLTYPANWEAVPGYSTYGDRFEGDDGFFIINAAGGNSIDEVAGNEASHRLQPYGSQPLIEVSRIQGQDARFIWPSADANMEDQAALIVRMPQPVTISGNTYEHLILYAHQDHMRDLVQSLRFDLVSDSNFWADAGISPDTMIALLVQPEEGPSRFGDIATMRADGRDLNQITTYNFNADPVLSPDGRRIAYRSVPITITSLPEPGSRLNEGSYNIWVITIDGAQAWQLTQSEEVRSIPSWSADSRRVVFSQGAGELIEVDVDSQSQRIITQGAFSPRYRPGGDGIGFISEGGDLSWIDDAGTVRTISAAGGLPSNTTVNDFDWFPDGQHIVYTLADDSDRVIEDLEIGVRYSTWIATADGATKAQVAEEIHHVKVSPDGLMIAGLQGSGYVDACMVDSRLSFLQVASDRSSVQVIDFSGFTGYPQTGSDQTFYPLANVTWVADHTTYAEFGQTCLPDFGIAGRYMIDPGLQRLIQLNGS